MNSPAKKLLAAILSAAMLASLVPAGAFDAEDTPDAAPADIAAAPNAPASAAPEDTPDAAPDDDPVPAPAPVTSPVTAAPVTHTTGYVPMEDESAPHSVRGEAAVLAETLPAAYRTPNLPAVRNQDPYGTCWAFAAIGCAEISLIRQGLAEPDKIDLSELQLVQMAYSGPLNAAGRYNDPLNNFGGDRNFVKNNILENGGNRFVATRVLASWMGVTPEDGLTAYNTENAEKMLAEGLPYSYAFAKDAAHLENVRFIPLDTDPAVLKQLIMEYGALDFSYYQDFNANPENESYYYLSDVTTTNHAVIIVGWDDTVPAEKFYDQVHETRPEHDGAWIVRNSWGPDWGENGYFYLSYENATFCASLSCAVTDYAAADEWDACYQYDGAACADGQKIVIGESAEHANIFRAVAGESIGAVSFWSGGMVDLDYSVAVYTGLAGRDDPTAGTLAAEVSGTTDYDGYYTIPLPEPVDVAAGELFSVVVTYTGRESYTLAIDKTDAAGPYSFLSYAEPGQSVYWDEETDTWLDIGEFDSNFRIKAFTTRTGEEALAVQSQPQSVTADVGSTARFTVIAAGEGLSYRWQYKAPTGTKWANTSLSGNRTDTLSVPATAGRSGYSYRCIVTDAAGNTATTEPAVLTVNGADIVSGTFSGALRWQLDRATGALRVTGTGSMSGAQVSAFPWNEYGKEIRTIEIGSGVRYIAENAFKNCTAVTDITLSDTVAGIGDRAFEGCSSLENIFVAEGNETYSDNNGVLFSDTALVCFPPVCTGNYAIPEGTTEIKPYAFAGSALISVTIPASVTAIGEKAFASAQYMTDIFVAEGNETYYDREGVLFSGTTLVCFPTGFSGTYKIPYGTERIANYAFRSVRLTEITIPASVTSIATNAIILCDELQNIFVAEDNEAFYDIDGVLFSGSTLLAYPGGRDGAYTVPDGTTAINGCAFFVVKKLTGLSLPLTLSSVGLQGVFNCEALAEVRYPGTAELWSTVSIDSYNDSLKKAAFVYGSAPLAISAGPADVYTTAGEKAEFTVTASGTGLTYQWQYKSAAGKKWANTTLKGNKTATLTVSATAARSGFSYRCIVTDAAGNNVTTEPAALTVLGFTAQPVSVSAVAGDTVTFTCAATDVGAEIIYQWYFSDNGVNWRASNLTGNKTPTLTVRASTVRDGYQYCCIISDGNDKAVSSDDVVLRVLGISSQPKSVSAAAGTTAKFTVAATGEDLTYQWQYRSATGTKWYNTTLTGNKTDTLSVKATTGRNGFSYRCIITDAAGNTVTTNGAKLTVG